MRYRNIEKKRETLEYILNNFFEVTKDSVIVGDVVLRVTLHKETRHDKTHFWCIKFSLMATELLPSTGLYVTIPDNFVWVVPTHSREEYFEIAQQMAREVIERQYAGKVVVGVDNVH